MIRTLENLTQLLIIGSWKVWTHIKYKTLFELFLKVSLNTFTHFSIIVSLTIYIFFFLKKVQIKFP
jgi:hypothetical protein